MDVSESAAYTDPTESDLLKTALDPTEPRKSYVGKGLTAAGLILNGFGSILKVGAILQQGAKSKEAYGLSAASALRAAGDAVERGRLREYVVTADGSRVIATQRAESSTGALDVNVGAQQATERASQANLEFNRAVVRRNAALEAYGYQQRAQEAYQAGEYAEEKARSEALGTFLGVLPSLV